MEKELNHRGGRNVAFADGHVEKRGPIPPEVPRAVPGVSERRTHIGLEPLAAIALLLLIS